MIRRVLIPLALVLASAFSGTAGRAAVDPSKALLLARNYFFIPGDIYRGTTVVHLELVLPQGTKLQFMNLDNVDHNIRSGDIMVDGYDGNGLFSAPAVYNRCDAGELDHCTDGSNVASVTGVENLPPGTYRFFCAVHNGVPAGTIHIV